MPPAARVGDVSTHGGVITGPGNPKVLVSGMPVAVVGDLHTCALPPNGHQPTVSPFTTGASKVLIGGVPALTTASLCACGAAPAIGAPTVIFN